MSNVLIFKEYLKRQGINLEEGQLNDGGVFFRTHHSFSNGGSGVLIIQFNNDEDIIDISLGGITHIDNPLKKEAIHSLINELNRKYRFTKFYHEEGQVILQYSFIADKGKLDPQMLMDAVIVTLNTAEESYPKFMKLQWG